MSSVLTCPDCESKVRLKQSVAAGKKVRCPKCEAVFVVPDDDEEDEDRRTSVKASAPAARRSRADDDEEMPRRKSRRREEDEEDEDEPRPKKKKKKKSGGVPVLVWVLLGVLVLAGGGVGIYFAVSGKDKGKETAKDDDKDNSGKDKPAPGNEGKLTLENFNKIKLNMAEEEVTRLIGPATFPGQDQPLGGAVFRTHVWEEKTTFPPDKVTLAFTNGKLLNGTGTIQGKLVIAGQQAPVGGTDPGPGTGKNNPVTLANWKKLEDAMMQQKLSTRAQAEAIMGTPTASLGKQKTGNRTSNESLEWKDGNRSIIVHFMGSWVELQRKGF